MISNPISILLILILFNTSYASEQITFQDIIVTSKIDPKDGITKEVVKKEIQFIQPAHISEIANQSTAVQIHRGNGIEHLTAMRSPILTGGAGAGSFLYLIDGIPLRSPGFGNINGLFEASLALTDIMEITLGPGDFFYGMNSQHGVVNMVSMPPSKIAEKKIEFSTNNNQAIFTTLSQSNSNSSGGYRISADITHDPGFRASSSLDNQFLAFRKDWLTPQMNIQMAIQLQNLDQETAGYIEGYESYKNYTISKRNPDSDAYRKSKAARAYTKFIWNLPKTSELTITPHIRFTTMDFLMHFLPSKALEETKHYSVGIQSHYKQNLSKHSTIRLGLDSEYTQGFLSETQNIDPGIPSFPVGTHYHYKIDSILISPYGSYRREITNSFIITLGIRLDSMTYLYDNKTADDIFGKYLRISDRTNSFLGISPQLDIDYHITEQQKLFLKIRRRSRPPQTTDLYRLEEKQIPEQVQEETIDSIELGIKRKNFKCSSFYMKKNNFFFRDVDGFNVVAGKTIHYGIEADLKIDLPLRFYLNLNLTYAHHQYDFNNSVSSVSNSTEAIQKGDYVDSAPKYFGNIRLGLRFLKNSKLELEWISMGSYYIDASNDHLYRGHNLFNLRFQTMLTSHLALFSKISNILNARYAERADYFRSTYRYFPGEGLGIRVGLVLKY